MQIQAAGCLEEGKIPDSFALQKKARRLVAAGDGSNYPRELDRFPNAIAVHPIVTSHANWIEVNLLSCTHTYVPAQSFNMALTEFNLLKSISVPNVGKISPKGLMVVAGPNSSGKTQLLTDIQASCTGSPRELVVCSDVEIEHPSSLNGLLQALKDTGAIALRQDADGKQYYEQTSPYLGEGSGGWRMEPHMLQHHFNQMRANNLEGRKAFYEPIGKTLVTSLFLRRRLQTTDTTKSFDYETQHPQNELQALYVNHHAQQALSEEIRKTFGRAVWLDASRGGKLCLRVSDSPSVPSDADRLQPERMKSYRTIDSEGDGLKSYTAICISLLLGQRPICLVDEPEMCLHPPQAYALGKFIGKYGTSDNYATIVATHSSHILRGIIEATQELQVLRLSRTRGKFVGNLIPYATLEHCIQRPSTKVETILDGIFSQAVAIVESEGDRAVYEAATEKLGEQLEHDVHFVSVGGVGGFASTSQLYKKLKIPTVIISDLDLLGKLDLFKLVLCSLAPQESVDEICALAQSVLREVKTAGPRISKEDLVEQLNQILMMPMDWSNGDNEHIRKAIATIPSTLSDLSLLKRGGRTNYSDKPTVLANLDSLLAECKRHGLFLVPVGELEYWCESLMSDGPSRQKKAEWANEVAVRIRLNPIQHGDIWAFVEGMTSFQKDEMSRLAGY